MGRAARRRRGAGGRLEAEAGMIKLKLDDLLCLSDTEVRK